mgnify:CR=1 FL=1
MTKRPTSGGTWLRDPVTGELRRPGEPPVPAPASAPEPPAEPEPAVTADPPAPTPPKKRR